MSTAAPEAPSMIYLMPGYLRAFEFFLGEEVYCLSSDPKFGVGVYCFHFGSYRGDPAKFEFALSLGSFLMILSKSVFYGDGGCWYW